MNDIHNSKLHGYVEGEREAQRQYWHNRSAELRREADARKAAEAGLLDDAFKWGASLRDE